MGSTRYSDHQHNQIADECIKRIDKNSVAGIRSVIMDEGNKFGANLDDATDTDIKILEATVIKLGDGLYKSERTDKEAWLTKDYVTAFSRKMVYLTIAIAILDLIAQGVNVFFFIKKTQQEKTAQKPATHSIIQQQTANSTHEINSNNGW